MGTYRRKGSGPIYIYGLYARGRLRYIGQAKNPSARLRGHWSGRNREPDSAAWHNPKNKWLRTLWEPPEMRILAIVEDADALRTERSAIEAARKRYGKWILNSRGGAHDKHWRAAMASGAEWIDKRNADPEYQAALNAGIAARNARPEYRDALSDARQIVIADPGYSSTMSSIMSRRWADPVQREAMLAGMRQANQDPAVKAKRSISQKGICSDCLGPTDEYNPACQRCRTRKTARAKAARKRQERQREAG